MKQTKKYDEDFQDNHTKQSNFNFKGNKEAQKQKKKNARINNKQIKKSKKTKK